MKEGKFCGGCKESVISESGGVVVAFGDGIWHVDCFRCAGCRDLVSPTSSLLLLSDGSPMCINCIAPCAACSKPITEEAIVTDKEAYHASCFVCRSCHTKIEELVFAETKFGIYCMACHNARVAKSRKYAGGGSSGGTMSRKMTDLLGLTKKKDTAANIGPSGSGDRDIPLPPPPPPQQPIRSVSTPISAQHAPVSPSNDDTPLSTPTPTEMTHITRRNGGVLDISPRHSATLTQPGISPNSPARPNSGSTSFGFKNRRRPSGGTSINFNNAPTSPPAAPLAPSHPVGYSSSERYTPSPGTSPRRSPFLPTRRKSSDSTFPTSMPFTTSSPPYTPIATTSASTPSPPLQQPSSAPMTLDAPAVDDGLDRSDSTNATRSDELSLEKLRGLLRAPNEDMKAWMYAALNDPTRRTAILALTGATAQAILELLQKVIDHEEESSTLLPECQKTLWKLSQTSGMLPSSLFLSDIQRLGELPVVGGGFADVWSGSYRGTRCALKVLRVFTSPLRLAQVQRDFCKEAIIWRQLKHPNIAPFFGVSKDLFAPHLCMVSPWMVNGNIISYLESNPSADRDALCLGIARGTLYLHSLQPPLIHGDMRGANILVDDNLNPVLVDFGITTFSDTLAAATNSNSMKLGSVRWMAPELFTSNPFNDGETYRRGTASDIYAFGCVCLEIFTGEPPFAHLSNEAQVMFAVLQRQPPRSTLGLLPSITGQMQGLLHWCWAANPNHRPTMQRVIEALEWGYEPVHLTPQRSKDESSFRTERTGPPILIQFTNTRLETLELYWLNEHGDRVLYKVIASGENAFESTFVGHPWVVVERSTAEVLGIWIAEDQCGGYALAVDGIIGDGR